MNGGQDEKKPQKMVRSSIACARCRRSKVKCVNNGVNSTCKACLSSNRECTYPPSGATSAPKRSEASGMKQDEGESKKRVRKSEDAGRRNSERSADPLESPILTRRVWDELYDIFKLHFSTEMPFLHPPTFKKRMRQASFPREPTGTVTDLQNGRLLLLAVLTLTARFHPDLVAYHSLTGKPIDPMDASEFYATALKMAFGPAGTSLTSPSVDSIQALLMLGLYEWGQSRGLSAWIFVGIAIRLAQSIALAYEDDAHNRAPKPKLLNRSDPRLSLAAREEATEKEVRRRTLWSCFIMDRMLSAGKFRPNMILINQLRVQLPCTDDQFLFVHNVQTGFLTADWLDENSAQSDSVNDDGVLSRYIRLVEIFGRFSEWSYAGGRRTEKLPPWDESTQFYQLRQELEAFHDALPSNLTFDEANLSAHIEKKQGTTYTSLHTLYSLCLIMLHREYIPFIPLRCEQPQGPLDEPTFPKEKYQIPDGFWEESTETLFRAARDIVEIVRTCQDNSALPESPQIGFAVYQAAFVFVYGAHFRHMDTNNYLHPYDSSSETDGGYDAITVKILKDMIPRLQMAKGYIRSLKKMHDYFTNIKNDYFHRFQRKPFGWTGGGLEQYKLLEKELKEFGSLEDIDRNIPSDTSDIPAVRSRASTNDPGPINGDSMQGIEAQAQAPTPRAGAWAAVNATPSSMSISPKMEAADDGPIRLKYAGSATPSHQTAYPYGPTYQPSPAPSTAPSLISPTNGDSNSTGTTSPYPSAPSHVSYPLMGPPNPQSHSQAQTANGLPLSGAPNANAQTAQEWTDLQNQQWLYHAEQITMSDAHFDNYVQDGFPALEWAGNGMGQVPGGQGGGAGRGFFGLLGGFVPGGAGF